MNKLQFILFFALSSLLLQANGFSVCEDIKQQTSERTKELSDIGILIPSEKIDKKAENDDLFINPGVGVGSCKIGESFKSLLGGTLPDTSKSADGSDENEEDGDKPEIERNIPKELKGIVKKKANNLEFYSWPSRGFYFLVSKENEKIQTIIIRNPTLSVQDTDIRVGNPLKKEYKKLKGINLVPSLDNKSIWAISIP